MARQPIDDKFYWPLDYIIHMPRPGLFIIGAMKSGTTSLHAYLATHPEIFMSEPKEPAYFVQEMNYPKGEDWYLSLFAAGSEAKLLGESSAVYTMAPKFTGVTERIAHFNPDARFVYVMRDPFQRSLSHYWHIVQHHGERRDLLTALKTHPPYVNVSYYAMQLRPYLETFGRDRLHIVIFEDLVRDPLPVVQRLFGWLGVDQDFVPPNLYAKENATPSKVAPKGGRLDRFRHSAAWNVLGGFMPSSLRALARRLLERQVDKRAETVAEAKSYLRPIQLDQVNELRVLLDRDFPDWPAGRQSNQPTVRACPA
jgi:hypothetical protein